MSEKQRRYSNNQDGAGGGGGAREGETEPRTCWRLTCWNSLIIIRVRNTLISRCNSFLRSVYQARSVSTSYPVQRFNESSRRFGTIFFLHLLHLLLHHHQHHLFPLCPSSFDVKSRCKNICNPYDKICDRYAAQFLRVQCRLRLDSIRPRELNSSHLSFKSVHTGFWRLV